MSRTYIEQRLRRLVIERSGGHCEYCRTPERFSTTVFHIDHIISEKQCGPTESANLAWACVLCNLNKGDSVSARFYEEDLLLPLYNPRTDDWSAHFRVDKDGMIVPLTMIAKGTIRTLKLNLPERVEERELFLRMGIKLL